MVCAFAHRSTFIETYCQPVACAWVLQQQPEREQHFDGNHDLKGAPIVTVWLQHHGDNHGPRINRRMEYQHRHDAAFAAIKYPCE